MFLLRADSFPEEAVASWTYVVVIVQAPVNKAMPDTKWTHRHRVRAPGGSTSTSVIGKQARKREKERERDVNHRQCYFQWCWVSRWESRISNRTHMHVNLHAVNTLVHSTEPHTRVNPLSSVTQCGLIVYNALGSCRTLLTCENWEFSNISPHKMTAGVAIILKLTKKPLQQQVRTYLISPASSLQSACLMLLRGQLCNFGLEFHLSVLYAEKIPHKHQ